MKNSLGPIAYISGISIDIPLSENLKDFPDTAKTMQLCYATIADLLHILDDKKHLSEVMFDQIETDMYREMNILNDCLVDIGRDEVEVDRFNRMEKYYHEVRSDALDHLMSQIDESYYDINTRLQKMFDTLSDIIISLENNPFSKCHLRDFRIQIKYIKNILKSKKYQDQMTVHQYHSRSKKYNTAFAYVKKIRAGR